MSRGCALCLRLSPKEAHHPKPLGIAGSKPCLITQLKQPFVAFRIEPSLVAPHLRPLHAKKFGTPSSYRFKPHPSIF